MKERLLAARVAKDETARGILQVAIGDIQLQEGRGKTADPVIIIKKIIKSNTETAGFAKGEPLQKLLRENEILSEFLPKTATQEHILNVLSGISDSIQNAKSEGQAIGMAFKFLKDINLPVENSDVAEVVKKFRSQH